MKRFEAQHGLGKLLDGTMVLLKDIIQVFDLQNFNQLAHASYVLAKEPIGMLLNVERFSSKFSS